MKKENGSALITVILIVFVMAMIGSALISFVMVNFKFRDLDNRIAKAEYEAEKKVDIIYMLMQQALNDTISYSTEACDEIEEKVKEDEEKANAALDNSSEVDGYYGRYAYFDEVTRSVKRNEQTINDDIEAKYLECMHDRLFENIKAKIRDYPEMSAEKEIALIEGVNTKFGQTNFNTEIKIIEDPDESGIYKKIIKLDIFYDDEQSPSVEFSIDFIIEIPNSETANSSYRLDSLINLTNWVIQERKHI